jgi:tungstate transport system permease protein
MSTFAPEALCAMSNLSTAFSEALRLIANLDSDLIEIIVLSLWVSLSALAIAALIGFPLGAILATARFRGRSFVLILMQALMGLPPVVAGLAVYLMLSNSGPLGVLQLLYTPAAMIVVQALLILPIVTSLSAQTLADLSTEYDEQLRALGAEPRARMETLLWDARYSLITALLAGLGRAVAEVGGVMIVGGNIDHVTRTMTTTIALETSKGNLPLALGLGIILLLVSLAITAAATSLRATAQRLAYA